MTPGTQNATSPSDNEGSLHADVKHVKVDPGLLGPRKPRTRAATQSLPPAMGSSACELSMAHGDSVQYSSR